MASASSVERKVITKNAWVTTNRILLPDIGRVTWSVKNERARSSLFYLYSPNFVSVKRVPRRRERLISVCQNNLMVVK
jgi:hypothetical protein